LSLSNALKLAGVALSAVVLLWALAHFLGLAAAFAPGSDLALSRSLTVVVSLQIILAAVGFGSLTFALAERFASRNYVGSVGVLVSALTAVTAVAFVASPFQHRIYLKMAALAAYEGVRPSVSPDGWSVLYGAQWRGRAGSEIVVASVRNGTTQRLTNSRAAIGLFPGPIDWIGLLVGAPLDPAGPYNGEPSYSPDGSKVVFISNRDRNREIYIMNADGSAPIRLTHTATEDESYPSISPDGAQIVFTRTRSRPARADTRRDCVWVMRVDGSSQRPLTEALEEADCPSWSPDGRAIVFYGQWRGWFPPRVWIVNSDGTNPRALHPIGKFPCYSPDAKSLVMVDDQWPRGRPCEITISASDGSRARHITTTPRYKVSPRFTPDGKSVTFALDRDRKSHNEFIEYGRPRWEIWIIGADGSSPRLLGHAHVDISDDEIASRDERRAVGLGKPQ
jgi:Tol biopolymer transport system component